jgi:DnaJ domain
MPYWEGRQGPVKGVPHAWLVVALFGLSTLLAILIFSDDVETPVLATIVLIPAAGVYLGVKRRRAAFEHWRQQLRQRRGTERRSPENILLEIEQRRPWWEVLEIPERSTVDDVKSAYRAKIKQYHPDRVMGLAKEFQELADRKTKEINGAYRQARRAGRAKSPPGR